MSLSKPPKNKMIVTPPAKKGFHFASDGIHEAIYIEADTIEEAEELYHKRKKLIVPVGGTVSPPAPAPEPEEKTIETQ